MKRILAALGITSLAVIGVSTTAIASPAESPGGDKITICHATGSETNPYVPVSIDLHGLSGHGGSHHQHSEDVIPANSGTVLPGGQNVDKMAWLEAGCQVPGNGNGNGNGGHKITICHATGSETNPFVVISIDLHGLRGHGGSHHQHSEDIIPPNSGTVIPGGQNWTAKGQATFNNGCKPAEGRTTAVPPAVPPVVPGAPAPRGAVAGPGAAVANNPGFNVQTAVAGSSELALVPWAGGLAVMLLAAAGVAARKAVPARSAARRRE